LDWLAAGNLAAGGPLACGARGKVALVVSGTLLVELAERLADSGPPVLTPRPIGRELVATTLTEALVLLCVLAFCLRGSRRRADGGSGSPTPRRSPRSLCRRSRSPSSRRDAISCALVGSVSKGEHADAPEHLKTIGDAQGARYLRQLLPLKTPDEYDPAPVSAAQARKAVEAVRRLIEHAEEKLNAALPR